MSLLQTHNSQSCFLSLIMSSYRLWGTGHLISLLLPQLGSSVSGLLGLLPPINLGQNQLSYTGLILIISFLLEFYKKKIFLYICPPINHLYIKFFCIKKIITSSPYLSLHIANYTQIFWSFLVRWFS